MGPLILNFDSRSGERSTGRFTSWEQPLVPIKYEVG